MKESELQKQCVKFLSMIAVQYDFVFFAPMNENGQRVAGMLNASAKQRGKIKQHWLDMGAFPGASDLAILHDGKAYFVEVKVTNGNVIGGQSYAQKQFETVITTRAKCQYAIIRSVIELQRQLMKWGITK